MKTITEYLASIEAREKAATKADWIHCNRAEGKIILCKTDEEARRELVTRYGRQTVDLCEVHPADAEFIANAPEDMRALLKLARKYREALEVACVASCSCMTKSGDYELHAETCRYKQLRTALAYDPARGREMTGPVLEERTNREGSG